MRDDDLSFTATLHRTALPHGLFPRLGVGYLRAYHRTYMDSPHAVALIAEQDGDRCGFLLGTVCHDAHNRFVIRSASPGLAFAGMRSLLIRPRLAASFLRTRLPRYLRSIAVHLRRRPPPTNASGERTSSRATLSHVAVHVGHRGNGSGAQMVRGFTDTARSAGASTAALSTRADGDGAEAFYARLGWTRTGSFVDREGLDWSRFALSLT